MRTCSFCTGILFALLFLLCITPAPAMAYIDPGTGSYVIQVLVGAALGGMMSIKIFWRRIVGFIRRRTTADNGRE